MVKFKKVLKKLAQLGSSKGTARPAAQAAARGPGKVVAKSPLKPSQPAAKAAKKEVIIKKKSVPMASANAKKKRPGEKPNERGPAPKTHAGKGGSAAKRPMMSSPQRPAQGGDVNKGKKVMPKAMAKKPTPAPLKSPGKSVAPVRRAAEKATAEKATDRAADKPHAKKAAAVVGDSSKVKKTGHAPIRPAPEAAKSAKGAPTHKGERASERPHEKAPEKTTSERMTEKAVERTAEKSGGRKGRDDQALKAGAVAEGEADAESTEGPDEVILTDAEGRRYCRVKDCDQISMVDGYCRYHYLLFWKKIQVRKKILSEGKLERYIEELTARYPDKYLEMLKKDLRSEKEFMAAITELEIDESGVDAEFEDEAQSYLDEVRGMSGEGNEREEEY